MCLSPHEMTSAQGRVLMISKEKVADVLEAAADLYESEKYEWCQGAYYQGDFDIGISMCASQALRTACGERLVISGKHDLYPGRLKSSTKDFDDDLFQAAAAALDLAAGRGGQAAERYLIEFNDTGRTVVDGLYVGSTQTRRTKQEVIDLFKDKAKELRNQA